MPFCARLFEIQKQFDLGNLAPLIVYFKSGEHSAEVNKWVATLLETREERSGYFLVIKGPKFRPRGQGLDTQYEIGMEAHQALVTRGLRLKKDVITELARKYKRSDNYIRNAVKFYQDCRCEPDE